MNFIEELTAVGLLVDFYAGVTFGVVGGAVYGSKLEDNGHSLLGGAPDSLSAGARMLFGVHTRDDGYLRDLLHRHGQGRGPKR
jgi:hypothetical protein